MTDFVTLHSVLVIAAAMALLFAAAHDVAVRTVPNSVPLVVAAAGLSLRLMDGHLAGALIAGALVFAGAWYCWRRSWIGGGDVKLLSACVLLVPPGSAPMLILGTAVSGGVLALIYVAVAQILPYGARPRSANLVRRVWHAERRRIRRRQSLPYACAIVAGAALTLFQPSFLS